MVRFWNVVWHGTTAANLVRSASLRIDYSVAGTALAMIVAASVPGAGSGPGGDVTLETVIGAHRAVRSAIRTLSCKIDVTTSTVAQSENKTRVIHSTADYVRSGDEVRVRARIGDREEDCHLSDSRVRAVHHGRLANGTPTVGAGVLSATRAELTDCDVWTRALLLQNLPDTVEYYPFEELVQKSSRSTTVQVTRDGRSMTVVRLRFSNTRPASTEWTVAVYLDPGTNYLVREMVYETVLKSGRILTRDYRVSEFTEPAPGLFFPARVECRSALAGKQWTTVATTFSEVRVNQPVPRDAFRLTFPDNVAVADNIRGEVYRVDTTGKQISPPEPLTRAAPPPILLSEGDVKSTPSRTRTMEEPTPGYGWLVAGSLGTLAVAGIIAAWRRLARR